MNPLMSLQFALDHQAQLRSAADVQRSLRRLGTKRETISPNVKVAAPASSSACLSC